MLVHLNLPVYHTSTGAKANHADSEKKEAPSNLALNMSSKIIGKSKVEQCSKKRSAFQVSTYMSPHWPLNSSRSLCPYISPATVMIISTVAFVFNFAMSGSTALSL